MNWSRFLDFSLFRGIGRNILISFLLLSLIPLSISTFVGYRSSREELSRAVLARLDAQADFKVYRIGEFIDPVNDILQSLLAKQGDLILEMLPGFDGASDRPAGWLRLQVRTLFDGVVSGNPDIQAVGFTDVDGNLLTVRPDRWAAFDPKALATPDLVGRRSRSPGLAMERVGPDSAQSLIFSYRIHDSNGRVRGFLIALVDSRRLTEAVGSGEEVGRTGQICLTNQDGYLVFSSNAAALRDLGGRRLRSESIDRCLQGASGEGVYANHQDVRVHGVYRWLPNIKSCLLVELDTREAFATLNLLRNQAVTIGLMLFVLLFLTSIFITRGITRPIHRLVAAVQETARGDLGKEVTVQSKDEIGMLAREFNVMAEKLRLSYAGLEEKVEQRTRELKAAQDQLIQIGKLAAVGELAGGMAHEINNPTGIILTRVGYLLSEIKDGRLSLEFEDDLKTLEIHAKRIARITNGLLTFSRHSTFELKSVEIGEVIDGSIGIVEHRLQRHGVRLVRDIPPELPTIVADANYLEQVFINLLNNALDAMEDEGEIRLRVRHVGDDGDRSSLEIEVADNGSGIAAENLDKIFDPFFTTKEVGKGTGLGLSISYGIIQEHGGTIGVDSRPDQGATFIIRLPVSTDGDRSVEGGG